jgi:hypothetical protein
MLRIYYYGEVITSGENDPVKAKTDIYFVQGDQKSYVLILDDEQLKAPLELIKKRRC